MALFAIGALIFSTASSMNTVIVGRFFQGPDASGLDVLEDILVADITNLKERPKYLGILAVPIATGSVIGPIIGGLFSQFVNWRWIGWVNLLRRHRLCSRLLLPLPEAY